MLEMTIRLMLVFQHHPLTTPTLKPALQRRKVCSFVLMMAVNVAPLSLKKKNKTNKTNLLMSK
jgi:hypothetical protein